MMTMGCAICSEGVSCGVADAIEIGDSAHGMLHITFRI